MKKRIAVIEDDMAICQMYRVKFETEGYEVETAENGRLGLELVEKMRPDMVLLDLMMPEMNGDEMLSRMRRTDWGRSIKVIVLTNMGEQEAIGKLDMLNIEAFIVKAEMTPKQVAELVKSKLK